MAGEKALKKEQFENRILGELNMILRTRFNNPRLQLLSFTKVEVSSDLSVATVYWDCFDETTRGDAKKAVETIVGKLRSHLAQALKVRSVPLLRVKYDGQYDAEKEIDQILKAEEKLGKGF